LPADPQSSVFGTADDPDLQLRDRDVLWVTNTTSWMEVAGEHKCIARIAIANDV
jgi:hypothetical protein